LEKGWEVVLAVPASAESASNPPFLKLTDILDVDVIKTEKYENTKDTAFVKFSTKNWVDGEAEMHFYEGTWQTVLEDGVYKMRKSKILEVDNPGWDWFYE
jgi:hypothetical protein